MPEVTYTITKAEVIKSRDLETKKVCVKHADFVMDNVNWKYCPFCGEEIVLTVVEDITDETPPADNEQPSPEFGDLGRAVSMIPK